MYFRTYVSILIYGIRVPTSNFSLHVLVWEAAKKNYFLNGGAIKKITPHQPPSSPPPSNLMAAGTFLFK